MKTEQWDDMTEGMKEEPSVVTDYLETMFDELSEEDIVGFYETVFEKKPEADGREEIFSELLEELYVLTAEKPKEFAEVMKLVKKKLVR